MVTPKRSRVVWAVGGVAAASCVAVMFAVPACRALFYPEEVELREAYQDPPSVAASAARFDHSDFDRLLRAHVKPGGAVDYAALAKSAGELDRYIGSLDTAPFAELSRDDKLALLINAYNACTLRLILDHYPLASIRDIPTAERWEAQRWKIAGRVLSLDQIENQEIRPKFREPRIHFALVCAAVGCPPLRAEAYQGTRLEQQLAEQSRFVHSNARWYQFDAAAKELRLTALYDWYRGDFLQVAETVEDFAARFAPPLAEAIAEGRRPSVSWLPYDWKLNGIENRD